MPWVTRYAHSGGNRTPFQSWQVEMPRFHDSLPTMCIYLYPDAHEADLGSDVGGSGFVVGFNSRFVPGRDHLLFVTNRHVITGIDGKHGSPVVRLNTKSGTVKTIDLRVTDWILDHDTDLAVHLLIA